MGRARVIALLSLCVAACSVPALALSSLTFTAAPGAARDAQVLANGTQVLALRGRKALELATTISQRLTAAVEAGASADQVKIVADRKGAFVISVADKVIVTVDRTLAYSQSAKRDILAKQWRDAIAQVFSQPYLAVPNGGITLPVGESRTVPVRGAAPGDIAAAGFAANQISVTLDQTKRTVAVHAVAPGRTAITLTAGTATLVLPVRAMLWAGTVAMEPVTAVVTGDPAPVEVLRRAVKAAALRATTTQPGAKARVGDAVLTVASLRPGEETKASIPVAIEGWDFLPVRSELPLVLRNQAIPPIESSVLFFSNNPEQIRARGYWYEGRIEAGQQVRLLYHHVNGSGAPGELVVELVNLSQQESQVQVVEGRGAGSEDALWAGHVAASQFLERQARDAGYLVNIPVQQRFAAAVIPVSPDHTASGIVEYRALSGGPLSVRVKLAPPGETVAYAREDNYQPLPTINHWAFANPLRKISADYTVGGRWAFVSIGRRPSEGIIPEQKLLGDYGVIYQISLRMSNPTESAVPVELAFATPAGLARAVLLIDGRKYETPRMNAYDEHTLAQFSLGPNQQRELQVKIMPQSACHYPVTLMLRPVTGKTAAQLL